MRLPFATPSRLLAEPPHFFTLCVLAMFLLSAVASANDVVRHTLSFPENGEQLFLLRSEFPVNTPVTELTMPNWTPGSYSIRDYAVNVNRLSAVSGDGTNLPVQKIGKDRWQVNTAHTDKLIVDYEVHTPEISVRSSWASKAFSLINGASVFLYTMQSRELPQLLDIVAGVDRGSVFTALSNAPQGSGYQAEDYDELVDSPVAVAKAPVYRFSSRNQDYVLLNVAENEFWDGEQAALDVEKIVVETQSFWKVNPLKKPFWFMNFVVEAKGGLEHDHSTVIMAGRRQMRDRDQYIKWLGVVAHEFFHVWNVRHMRPAELAETDYQHEQYTEQLWLAEGLTSYYDNLLVSRAGLITADEYLNLLARDIYLLESTPGRSLRPVTEASVDAWIRHYRPNSNSINSTVSYYTKGAVIGFILDTYLRKESKNRHNLDEVMREMYGLYSDEPYGSDAFEKVVVDIGGPEAGEFLRSLLTTTAELDVDDALGWYGLKLDRLKPDSDEGPNGEPQVSGIGVLWDESKPGMVVKAVLSGNGGFDAGLIPGDEILAIGDERMTPDTHNSLMTSFRPGDETTLLVSRRGRIISLDIRLDAAIPDRFEIRLQSGYRKSHITRLQRLLGQNLGQQ